MTGLASRTRTKVGSLLQVLSSDPERTDMTGVATVCSVLTLRLVVPDGPSLPLLADLRYSADDPWAVRVAFQVGSLGAGSSRADAEVVEWLFARQLLTDGIAATVGEGDVRVWPSIVAADRVVHLAMASPSGSALFELGRDALVEFLQQTYLAVPTGTEEDVVDLDAELRLLLAG